ncbi:HAD family hydrolase [Bacillus sp. T33-2]|uniref:HAD family hydrolase n=1 Tax=Bacillus sp. T33-2 TaxID=2054168 RepID=UPI000C7689AE|nr:HAD family hydrolase [Bacillus sp. T33-2]PLR95193.1 Cof-type HAD-IIB family hydrolase [Bacillus sp. T33-2]
MDKYRILFLDIDGTILRPDDTIEESTKLAVSKMHDKGIEVVLATGRPLHEISEIAEELQIESFIGYNGALAIYKGKTIYNEPMGRDSVQYILDVAKESNHEVVLYTSQKNYVTTMDSPAVKEFFAKFHLRKNDLFTQSVIDDILGITVITTGKDGHSVYQMKEGIHFSQVNIEGMQHCFDVIRDNVNKGVGVKFLLERLGIPRESSIAFGDGMNDKEMLQYAGEGFAMGNAHPDLFQYADRRTTEVTDSGIFNGLKQLGLVR